MSMCVRHFGIIIKLLKTEIKIADLKFTPVSKFCIHSSSLERKTFSINFDVDLVSSVSANIS